VLFVVAGVALLLAATLAVNALTGGGDDGAGNQLQGSSTDSFKLSYPDGWRPLSKKRLDALPGNPLAVLRRKDGKGYVILRKEDKRAPRDFGQFSGELTRELEQRVPDFQKQSSRVVKIRAGEAFFYSYIRKRAGTVHSVLVVPAGKRSYAFNTVSRGGATDVARETAKIILSFDL
jgi:hypothetical protein